MKEKIAISIDATLLKEIDAKVDGITLQSRSQAIESIVRKGLESSPVRDAIIMSRPNDLKYLLTRIEGRTVLEQDLSLCKKAGIENVFLVTQEHVTIKEIEKEYPAIRIIKIKTMRGTADNVRAGNEIVQGDFVVINSDTYYDFDLKKMLEKHKESKRLVTLGIVRTTDAEKYGAVRLEGDMIVDFKQKVIASPVINAGVYVFSKSIFSALGERAKSIENDLLQGLVAKGQVTGFFMYGKYIHVQKMDNISTK